jgi:CheY-like chemotaxis protein/HPt (histidine-containing phosphotransfer) domain-containing protein
MVLLTSVADQSRSTLSSLGIKACLTKPLRHSSLRETLVRVLEGADSTPTSISSPPPARRAEPASAVEPEVEQRGTMRGIKLLAAEDNEANQEVLLGLSDYLGFEIKIAANGREALRELESNAGYDVVLMDCQMPEMDGYAAARAIRDGEARRRLPRIPIIAVTAHALQGEREKVLAAGMDDYMTKPVDIAVLRQKLERWVSNDEGTVGSDASVSGSAAADEAIDLDAVSQLKLLTSPRRPTFFIDLVEKYAGDAPAVIASIRAAAAAGDAVERKQRAHFLKGSSRTMGARQVAELCQRVELVDQFTAPETEAALTDELERAFERAVVRLRQLAAEPQPLSQSEQSARTLAR